MGPWDVMSAHFVDRKSPPPGLSSFIRIRLGWITPDRVVQVRPGETRKVLLWPLAEQGKVLAVKIPLANGQYYLVENRQPIEYDKGLPDSGILIVKVNPSAVEGTGTARIMDADPSSFNFEHATYKPEQAGRRTFIDRENTIAVVALSEKGKKMEVLITTPDASARAALR